MKKIDAIGLYHIGGGLTIPRCNLFSLIKRKFPLLIEAISYSDSRKFVVQIGDSFDIRTRMISREYFTWRPFRAVVGMFALAIIAAPLPAR